MKSFKDYVAEMQTMGDDDMGKMKVVAEQVDDSIVFYNSEKDRWSRNAKHQIRLQDIIVEEDILTEGVMGGMQQLAPINRIMQLAGLSTTSMIEPVTETEVQQVQEADATTMFQQLYNANSNDPKYKNNPQAAQLATIGQILVGLNTQITQLQGKIPTDLQGQLNVVVGLGARLLQTAEQITKPTGVQAE